GPSRTSEPGGIILSLVLLLGMVGCVIAPKSICENAPRLRLDPREEVATFLEAMCFALRGFGPAVGLD
ncbi:MAG TPA: hypothetical protein VMZ27_02885, partial [Candidatus Saccharimonadales bacterium]|nr:hypothetical protein [Candidatus Saccharimonadales bacterium]